jgi:hypothetical protein
MGFCFFGNVAVAARARATAHGAERVLILDWDVHHGNGTNEIFHADPSVLFVSIHESPLYPGTGPASDTGSGEGTGYTVNLPVPGGTGDAGYRSLVEHVAGKLIRDWRPQLVLVSAGFDAHIDDPLATCRVTEAGYAGMTASVRRAADDVGAPVGGRARGRLRPRRAVALDGGADAGPAGRHAGRRGARRAPAGRAGAARADAPELLRRDDPARRAAAGLVADLRQRGLRLGLRVVGAAEDHERVRAQRLEVVGVDHADVGTPWRRARPPGARRPPACPRS